MDMRDWDDLTREEQEALAAVCTGSYSPITLRSLFDLNAMGLVEAAIGRPYPTDEGRRVYQSGNRVPAV
jgi:hypothetical protein